VQDGLARALKFTRYLAEIYHPYTNYEGVFRADNLIALWERVQPAERLRYPFALHNINWEEYLFKTHFPGIRKCGVAANQTLSITVINDCCVLRNGGTLRGQVCTLRCFLASQQCSCGRMPS